LTFTDKERKRCEVFFGGGGPNPVEDPKKLVMNVLQRKVLAAESHQDKSKEISDFMARYGITYRIRILSNKKQEITFDVDVKEDEILVDIKFEKCEVWYSD
jgi:hypothetical protein